MEGRRDEDQLEEETIPGNQTPSPNSSLFLKLLRTFQDSHCLRVARFERFLPRLQLIPLMLLPQLSSS